MADLDSRSVGNMKQNAQNAEQTKVIRNSNRFPLDHTHCTTHRYADIDIFYNFFGERGDVVPMRTGHNVRTYTFASPTEIDIYMRKQFVHVPMKAIYPNTWDDVLYPLPVDGDIAPPNARANFDLCSYVNLLSTSLNVLGNLAPSGKNIGYYMKILDALSDVVSDGSLFAKVNYHFNNLVDFHIGGTNYLPFDGGVSAIYDVFSQALNGSLIIFDSIEDGVLQQYSVLFNTEPIVGSGTQRTITNWHQLHELIVAHDYKFDTTAVLDDYMYLSDMVFECRSSAYPSESNYINIEPIIAYQLSCAQFYTNDRVDNIFSANTYRNYIQALVFKFLEPEHFEFNDVLYYYDIFSRRYTDLLLTGFLNSLNREQFDDLFVYIEPLIQMFRFRKSLRFGDYFLGARTRPLAVGESSVPVTGDGVMIEDITKSAALQRLRYNINVLGRKINNQLMGLIPGKAPVTPDDIPTSISSQEFNIGKDSTEVSNTGAAQVDPNNPLPVTQHLNSGASDFAFKIEITEPCIILGLVSFSVPRVYSKTISRFAFHHDRYDMFIPQLQFTGDQEIYRKELFGLGFGDEAFAYNQRYSEYKQSYNFASGGFVRFLPSWEMITDNTEGLFVTFNDYLNSAFSHSSTSEFDRFYKSVSGKSLADYFHFIVKHYNTSTPERAMAWNPQPLL